MSSHDHPETGKAVLGIMSGTSLDGTDLASCIFYYIDGRWSYEITAATTVPYPDYWMEKLSGLHHKDAATLARTHKDYGTYLGRLAKDFIDEHGAGIGLVASHGHTIFHQPDHAYTFQLGDGSALAAATGIPVVCDFRSPDIALGGQGAPLVPVGDKLLFSDYASCLNIGGFANISFDDTKSVRRAFDVCPANIVINHLARQAGMDYDRDGLMAAAGSICNPLLTALENISYYAVPYPKSLGREWLEVVFMPVMDKYGISLEDKLRTVTEHAAARIIAAIEDGGTGSKVLVTGGGAKNVFLMDLIAAGTSREIIIPVDTLVNYKEALVFALLGLLRQQGRVNVYASVTGASGDSSSGSIYLP